MKIHSVMTMVIHQSCLSEIFKSVNLDDDYYRPSPSKSVSGTLYHKPRSSKLQWINKFLKYLIFLTPVLFVTLLRHSLTNQILLWILANHKLPMETPERIVNYHNRPEKFFAYCFPSPSTRHKFIVAKLKLNMVAPRKFMGVNTLEFSLFVIVCISCILASRLLIILENNTTYWNWRVFSYTWNEKFETTTSLVL